MLKALVLATLVSSVRGLASVRVEAVATRSISARALAPLVPAADRPKPWDPDTAAYSVTAFTGVDDATGAPVCGVLDGAGKTQPGALVEASVCCERAAPSPDAVLAALAVGAAVLDDVEEATKPRRVAILGAGSLVARVAARGLSGLGYDVTVVAPTSASPRVDLGAGCRVVAAGDLDDDAAPELVVDCAGCEGGTRRGYRSVVHTATAHAIENGLFDAAPVPPPPPVGFDLAAVTRALDRVAAAAFGEDGASSPWRDSSSSSSKVPFLISVTPFGRKERASGAVDEYADFFAWPRDADNDGRRLGLDVLLGGSAPTVSSEEPLGGGGGAPLSAAAVSNPLRA